jgi:hypothetical protein
MSRWGATWVGLALPLLGCGGEVVLLDAEGSDRVAGCLAAMLYLVQGDQFTRLSGSQQTLGDSRVVSATPLGWNPKIEPRAKARVTVGSSQSQAQLLWNDVVVQATSLTAQFLRSGQVQQLEFEDPDGTRVEFHLYVRDACRTSPAPVSTRAEIEALEQQ